MRHEILFFLRFPYCVLRYVTFESPQCLTDPTPFSTSLHILPFPQFSFLIFSGHLTLSMYRTVTLQVSWCFLWVVKSFRHCWARRVLVLFFESDCPHQYQLLRTLSNRFPGSRSSPSSQWFSRQLIRCMVYLCWFAIVSSSLCLPGDRMSDSIRSLPLCDGRHKSSAKIDVL